jgi:hypothetical protein
MAAWDMSAMAHNPDELLLEELDRTAPDLLGDGRPVRLVGRLDALLDRDLGEHLQW